MWRTCLQSTYETQQEYLHRKLRYKQTNRSGSKTHFCLSLSVSFIFHLPPQKQGELFVTFKNPIKYQQGLTIGPQYINDRTKTIFPRIPLCKLYNTETELDPIWNENCCSWLNIALKQMANVLGLYLSRQQSLSGWTSFRCNSNRGEHYIIPVMIVVSFYPLFLILLERWEDMARGISNIY